MRASLRPLLGLLLTGYGLLVLVGVLAHESGWAGALSLTIGLGLLAAGLPRLGLQRSRWVAALGAALVLGVLGYNLARSSTLGGPEWALLAYGVALVAVSPYLSRAVGGIAVGDLVGWSFPLLLAPLTLFAANGALSSTTTGPAASPLVLVLIVRPTAFCLEALGTPVDLVGRSMILWTDRGSLTLDVGLVCAGIYPMILFGGIVALHAWRERMPTREAALLVAGGVAGLWLINLLRLIALTFVGIEWGPRALERVHANLGWALFGSFMILFWMLALRPARIDPHRPAVPETA